MPSCISFTALDVHSQPCIRLWYCIPIQQIQFSEFSLMSQLVIWRTSFWLAMHAGAFSPLDPSAKQNSSLLWVAFPLKLDKLPPRNPSTWMHVFLSSVSILAALYLQLGTALCLPSVLYWLHLLAKSAWWGISCLIWEKPTFCHSFGMQNNSNHGWHCPKPVPYLLMISFVRGLQSITALANVCSRLDFSATKQMLPAQSISCSWIALSFPPFPLFPRSFYLLGVLSSLPFYPDVSIKNF